MTRAAFALVVAVAVTLGATGRAKARTLVDEGDFTLSLRSAFKSSLLLGFNPDDPILFPDPVSGMGLFRLRFELTANASRYFTASVAYEHRVRMTSGGVGSGLVLGTAPVAFRLDPLSWSLIDQAPSYEHLHEIDRAFVAVHLDFMELTVGRQAIGLGRGVLFSAVDVFSPFTPTQVDREWRRGIDAAHVELRIPSLSALSADVYAALGQAQASGGVATWAVIGRLRAVVGDVDGALLIGRRGEDNMVGGSVSATIGDAEAHAELAMFGTDGRGIDGGLFGTRAVVAKGLIGGSYMVDVGNGLRVVAEYHYSGFGVANLGDDASILLDPYFQARLARGDTQILGRHALALALSYDFVAELSGALSYLQSPVDGSGMVAGTVTWNQSDNVTIVLNVFAPWGTAPSGGVPTSEWGTSPITIFLQARIYD